LSSSGASFVSFANSASFTTLDSSLAVAAFDGTLDSTAGLATWLARHCARTPLNMPIETFIPRFASPAFTSPSDASRPNSRWAKLKSSPCSFRSLPPGARLTTAAKPSLSRWILISRSVSSADTGRQRQRVRGQKRHARPGRPSCGKDRSLEESRIAGGRSHQKR
jgi:hypothetical protein